MSENDGHLYGDEPVCSLCGHYGPDTDPQSCIPRFKAGELVHGLRRRLADAEKALGAYLAANPSAVDWWRTATLKATEAQADKRIDELLATNNRYLEEARIAKRMSAVTGSALAAAQVQIQVFREALEFYAEPTLYEPKVLRVEAGVTHEDPLPILDDLGTTAEQALQDVFGAERPPLSEHAAKCGVCGQTFDMRHLDQVLAHEHKGPHLATGIVGSRVDPSLDDLRDRFTPAELAVVDSTFGGGAKHDEIILRVFREAALARGPVKP